MRLTESQTKNKGVFKKARPGIAGRVRSTEEHDNRQRLRSKLLPSPEFSCPAFHRFGERRWPAYRNSGAGTEAFFNTPIMAISNNGTSAAPLAEISELILSLHATLCEITDIKFKQYLDVVQQNFDLQQNLVALHSYVMRLIYLKSISYINSAMAYYLLIDMRRRCCNGW